MSRFSTRTRGVTVQVMDLTGLEAEALQWRQESNPDCFSVKVHGGDWAIARKDDRLFALCSEGVGWEITDEDPLELEFHGSYHQRDEDGNVQENVTTFDFMPFGSYIIIPEDLEDFQVAADIDLADFVRTFGQRLESNFWGWFDELK